MKIPDYCIDLTSLIITVILCGTGLYAWYLYINNYIRMQVNKPPKNKITIQVLAAGFTAGWGLLLLPYAKTTLDVIYYGHRIDLYTPINIIMLLGTLAFGTVTGGIYLTNKFKPNG